MNRFFFTLAAAIAASSCAPATASGEKVRYSASPDHAWHVELKAGDAGRVAQALGAIQGVSRATVADERVRLEVHDGVVLSERVLGAAASAADGTIRKLLLPESARVTVYTAIASGGG